MQKLDQEAVKIIFKMRIFHPHDNIESILDPAFEKHAVEFFDLAIMSLGL